MACEGGYDSCKQKVIDSNTIVGQTLEIPVAENKRLIYSSKAPKFKVLKSDPFLGLYLIEDTTGFEYPFRINTGYPSGIAAVNKTSAHEGKIIKRQTGVTTLALFDKKVSTPSILTNSCCSLEGIVTPNGIIEKEYIERFLSVSDTSYGDIGIDVKDTKEGVIVNAFNPFVKNNPFNEGDYIISYDGKEIENSATLMRDILFADIGSSHKIQIKRGSKLISVEVVSQKREFIPFKSVATQKVEKNIVKHESQFDKSMKIITLDEKSKMYGLKIGDRLLQVNGVPVKNQEEMLKKISDFKKNDSLLFERDDFQFFVNVK